MLFFTDFSGEHIFPNEENSGNVLHGLSHTFLLLPVTQGTHQPVLAVAGSWVQAEAPWP